MGLLTDLVVGPSIRASYLPSDDFWYRHDPRGGQSATGITVSEALAFQVSCVFLGVRILAETMGSLPLILYREESEGNKERARDHELWELLREIPNAWQTSQEFREVLTARAVLWPGAYAEIRRSAGAVEELIPLEPDMVKVEQLKSGRLRYRLREPGQPQRTLVQEEVFRLRGFGAHRYLGADLLCLAREAIGLWIAQEKFEASFFRQGASPSLLAEHPSKLTPQQHEMLREDINEKVAGLGNMHKVLIAQDGMKWSKVGFNAQEAQMTESREAMVLEIARWLNVPAIMLGAAKQPTYASAEQFARFFVDYSIRPWCTRWEGSIRRSLIADDERGEVYAEFLLDALLRGNTLDRYQAYSIGVMGGFLAENEARVKENMNPWPGLWEPRRSVNQDRGGDPRGPRQEAPGGASPTPEEDEVDEPRASVSARRARLAWAESAKRVVRKEIATLEGKAPRFASDPPAWRAWVIEFYEEHAVYVADVLQLEPAIARAYASSHREALLAQGLAVLTTWNTEAVGELRRLASEEEYADATG